MLKINAGVSRKVGEPDYGSRGAAVHFELEVESQLLTDPAALRDRIRGLFQLAHAAVAAELQRSPAGQTGGNGHDDPAAPVGSRPDASAVHQSIRSTGAPSNGRSAPISSSVSRNNGSRRATESQVRAIEAIARRNGQDPEQIAHERFGKGIAGLSLREASQLIDLLKSHANAPDQPVGDREGS